MIINPKTANAFDRERGLPVLLELAPLEARLVRVARDRGCTLHEVLDPATTRALHRGRQGDQVQAHIADRVLCELNLQWFEVWSWGGDAELYFTGEIS